MEINLKLLLNNPRLNTNDYYIINNHYLEQVLGLELALPLKKPFIFSCFALSSDGRLCYPDLKSGFAIAKHNAAATSMERFADWWYLNLARACADAVLIGTNSLVQEQYNYTAAITIPKLNHCRTQINKNNPLWHILITRDCNQINFTQEILCQDNHIPLLIFTAKAPLHQPKYFNLSSYPDKNNPGAVPTMPSLSCSTCKQIITYPQLNLKHIIDYLQLQGFNAILNESPYFHHCLQELQLLQESWINTSAVYIGGAPTTLGQNNSAFTSTCHPHYSILTLHHSAYNFLYTRYCIDYI
jgi:riboflavin biosynthesis pyrimidine reductase